MARSADSFLLLLLLLLQPLTTPLTFLAVCVSAQMKTLQCTSWLCGCGCGGCVGVVRVRQPHPLTKHDIHGMWEREREEGREGGEARGYLHTLQLVFNITKFTTYNKVKFHLVQVTTSPPPHPYKLDFLTTPVDLHSPLPPSHR